MPVLAVGALIYLLIYSYQHKETPKPAEQPLPDTIVVTRIDGFVMTVTDPEKIKEIHSLMSNVTGTADGTTNGLGGCDYKMDYKTAGTVTSHYCIWEIDHYSCGYYAPDGVSSPTYVKSDNLAPLYNYLQNLFD